MAENEVRLVAMVEGRLADGTPIFSPANGQTNSEAWEHGIAEEEADLFQLHIARRLDRLEKQTKWLAIGVAVEALVLIVLVLT